MEGVVDKECHWKGPEGPGRDEGGGGGGGMGEEGVGGIGSRGEGRRIRTERGGAAWGEEYSDWLREEASGRLL